MKEIENMTFEQWSFIWDKLFDVAARAGIKDLKEYNPFWKALADHSRKYKPKWSRGL